MVSLKEKLQKKLSGAKFRLMTASFNKEKKARNIDIKNYHKYYKEQRSKWPVDPQEKILEYFSKFNTENKKIVDVGCGEGKLREHIPNIHLIDKYPCNDKIIKADMEKLPFEIGTVDYLIYSLSLLRNNLFKTFKEASRILKINGHILIVETKSRVKKNFLKDMRKVGLYKIHMEDINEYFVFIVFKKGAECLVDNGQVMLGEYKFKKQ